MSRFISISFVLLLSLATIIGCAKPHSEHLEHDGHDHANENAARTNSDSCDSHAGLHQSKHGGIVVEFPGHKYALEIIEDEATHMVTAFLTDAHFAPCAVDASEVRLNFFIAGKPQTFTLARIENENETGKLITFSQKDESLAELICEGWEGDAVAAIEIDDVPYQAKITPRSAHAGHSH